MYIKCYPKFAVVAKGTGALNKERNVSFNNKLAMAAKNEETVLCVRQEKDVGLECVLA